MHPPFVDSFLHIAGARADAFNRATLAGLAPPPAITLTALAATSAAAVLEEKRRWVRDHSREVTQLLAEKNVTKEGMLGHLASVSPEEHAKMSFPFRGPTGKVLAKKRGELVTSLAEARKLFGGAQVPVPSSTAKLVVQGQTTVASRMSHLIMGSRIE